jgi:hypothetical protein
MVWLMCEGACSAKASDTVPGTPTPHTFNVVVPTLNVVGYYQPIYRETWRCEVCGTRRVYGVTTVGEAAS